MGLVREGKHRCRLHSPSRQGEIWQCDDCGRYWRGITYPNWHLDKWVRIGRIERKFRGLPKHGRLPAIEEKPLELPKVPPGPAPGAVSREP